MCNKQLHRFVKGMDLFGQPVSFHFNGKGDRSNTIVGGFCSVLIKLFIFVYLLTRFKMLAEKQNNLITETIEPADFESLGEINMVSDSGILPFFVLADYTSVGQSFSEVSKYLQF